MSERYDYKEEVKKDIRQYIEDNWEKGNRITDSDRDKLYDDMFVADSVTGNASGSYTCNAWKAEEYVCHNLDLLGEALDEFCTDSATLRDHLNGEWADVTIRCYLLPSLLEEVVEEWNDECEDEDGEE